MCANGHTKPFVTKMSTKKKTESNYVLNDIVGVIIGITPS